jgi:hypothetical protein
MQQHVKTTTVMTTTTFLAGRNLLQAAGAAAALCKLQELLLLSCETVHSKKAKRFIAYRSNPKNKRAAGATIHTVSSGVFLQD